MDRIGAAYDLHRLTPGRPLRLGGVEIPSDRGLLGHSDADAVLHAVCGAILNALAQPDIGDLFPPGDPQWRDAASRVFVDEALRRMRAAGYEIGNLSIVVHAEQPRLGPHKATIRAAVAAMVGVAPERVGLMATTNEGLDAIGRGEALACWTTVLLVQSSP